MNLPRIFCPFRLKVVKKYFQHRRFNLLDVGCGNHSPSITKKFIPNCQYSGLDKDDYVSCDGTKNDVRDQSAMATYYDVDLDVDDLSNIPRSYDCIVMAHVIEHLDRPFEALERLAEKVLPGGLFYIEFPSARSLGLPSMDGTLNFSDDSTHRYVHDIREISNRLMRCGFRIIKAKTRRDWRRILLYPLQMPVNTLLRGHLRSSDWWDVLGFADYVLARRTELPMHMQELDLIRAPRLRSQRHQVGVN